MSMTQIAVDEATLLSLDAAAAFRSLSREEMLREAVQNLSDYDNWFHGKIEESLQAYDAGDVHSHEEVELEAEQRIVEILAMNRTNHACGLD